MEDKIPFEKRHPAVQKYILESVMRAGKARGACKVRGDAEYYRGLARKRVEAQKRKAEEAAASAAASAPVLDEDINLKEIVIPPCNEQT